MNSEDKATAIMFVAWILAFALMVAFAGCGRDPGPRILCTAEEARVVAAYVDSVMGSYDPPDHHYSARFYRSSAFDEAVYAFCSCRDTVVGGDDD